MLKDIELSLLHPYPKNPPPDRVVVKRLAVRMRAGGFDPAHPVKVRKNGKGYEILGGHMRHLAAQSAGLTEVPCVVVKLSDRSALFELAHDNAQRTWHPLDVGQHIIDTGLSIRKYMKKFGLKLGAVQQRLYSAQVYNAVKDDVNEDLRPIWRQMAVIYSAPRTQWAGLVEQVVNKDLNADGVRRILKERRSRETTPPASEEEDDGDMEGIEAAKVVPAVHVGDPDDDRGGGASMWQMPGETKHTAANLRKPLPTSPRS